MAKLSIHPSMNVGGVFGVYAMLRTVTALQMGKNSHQNYTKFWQLSMSSDVDHNENYWHSIRQLFFLVSGFGLCRHCHSFLSYFFLFRKLISILKGHRYQTREEIEKWSTRSPHILSLSGYPLSLSIRLLERIP